VAADGEAPADDKVDAVGGVVLVEHDLLALEAPSARGAEELVTLVLRNVLQGPPLHRAAL
jgi:hypothetical protein